MLLGLFGLDEGLLSLSRAAQRLGVHRLVQLAELFRDDVLLFIGATGKSAQIPLLTWLVLTEGGATNADVRPIVRSLARLPPG